MGVLSLVPTSFDAPLQFSGCVGRSQDGIGSIFVTHNTTILSVIPSQG
jgi:hypothetical protein